MEVVAEYIAPSVENKVEEPAPSECMSKAITDAQAVRKSWGRTEKVQADQAKKKERA